LFFFSLSFYFPVIFMIIKTHNTTCIYELD
jgi:hypothetical protein